MSAVANYLEEIYLYEEIKLIDEGFASWAQQLTQKKIIDKLKLAAQKKDTKMIEKIMSIFPKVSAEKLLKIGKKAHKDFKEAYLLARKEIAKRFPKISGEKKDYLSLALASFIVTSKDMKKGAIEITEKLKKSQGKKAVSQEGLFMGMITFLLSGAFIAAALSTLSLFPLLIGIVLASFSMLLLLEGAAY